MIHIAFCSDKNYLPWCAVPAKTSIEKTILSELISVHFILSEDCRDSYCLKRLTEKLAHPRVSVYTYFVDESEYGDLPVSGHGSIANYFRLLIPELLPKNIDKVIYLDCDLIVLESLSSLWSTRLGDAPLAAVSNMSLIESEATRLGIPYLDGTFNSGVLVMNLSRFRDEGIHFKCMDKAKQIGDKIVYWDQDVLNILVSGRWLKLDNAWNIQHGYILDPLIAAKYNVDDPKILHFSGKGLKPWQSTALPYSEAYMKEFNDFGFRRREPGSPLLAARKTYEKVKSIVKKVIKKGVSETLFNPALMDALEPVYRPGINRAYSILVAKDAAVTRNTINVRQRDILKRYFASLSVKAGPFVGMKYPSPQAIGSALLPKLAGSYEIEISQLFSKDFLANFTDFLDIGCAEGYYAVGAAMINPSLSVHAYDINADARRLCKAMAELNNVSNQVSIDKKFTLGKFTELKAATAKGACLILVDCEGAEASIFSSESRKYRKSLVDSTIIIEAHDFIRPGIADHLIQFFSDSHCLKRVLSVGDILRPSFYSGFVPAGTDSDTAAMILAENRPAPMEWMIFTPAKKNIQV